MQSTLSGTGGSVGNLALWQHGDSAKVALSQLVGDGQVVGGIKLDSGGTLECFNNYDENMAAVSCP